MPQPTILLLATHPAMAALAADYVRRAGYTVVPGWYHDHRDEATGRTAVDVALVQLEYHAAHSPAFRRMAEQLGVRLVFFTAGGDGAPLQTDIGYVATELGVPVVRLDPGGTDFIAALGALLAAGGDRPTLRERAVGGSGTA